jgi:hypothetical protein
MIKRNDRPDENRDDDCKRENGDVQDYRSTCSGINSLVQKDRDGRRDGSNLKSGIKRS